jgi:cytochrome b6-f complex iron-sulfur subunit
MSANRRSVLRGVLSLLVVRVLAACTPARNQIGDPSGSDSRGGDSGSTGDSGTNDSGTNDTSETDETGTDANDVVLALSDFPELAVVGGEVLLSDPKAGNIIVARVSSSSVVCLSSQCTHAGCPVQYNQQADRFDCPCHGSQFADDGTVIRGPANRPLASFQTEFDGVQVVIEVV